MSILCDMVVEQGKARSSGKRPTYWRMHPKALMHALMDGDSAVLHYAPGDGEKTIAGLPIFRDASLAEGGWQLEFGPVSDALREKELFQKLYDANRDYQAKIEPMHAELREIHARKSKAA
jgi:hypothetical protein